MQKEIPISDYKEVDRFIRSEFNLIPGDAKTLIGPSSEIVHIYFLPKGTQPSIAAIYQDKLCLLNSEFYKDVHKKIRDKLGDECLISD